MSKIIVLVGPAGSGKSTQAYTLEKGLGYTRISQDDQGKKEHLDIFNQAILDGKNIVVDRMNFDKFQRNRYLDPAKKAGYQTEIRVLHMPFAICFERCMERQNHPTIKDEANASSALNTFFKLYERVEDSEADVVDRQGWDLRANAPRGLIVDIDGTIAQIEHRRHHTLKTPEKPKANWGKFFAEMVNDTPNKWCVDLIKAFLAMSSNMTAEQKPYHLVFASGRPDNYREMTYNWLESALGYKQWDHLLMRPRNDFRADTIVKQIILDFELRTRYSELLFVDDRQCVVDMYRSNGYTVLQCDKGDF